MDFFSLRHIVMYSRWNKIVIKAKAANTHRHVGWFYRMYMELLIGSHWTHLEIPYFIVSWWSYYIRVAIVHHFFFIKNEK